MQTTLCFDFGNTRLKCAVFHDQTLAKVLVMDSQEPAVFQQLLNEYRPQYTLLSSVIDHNPGIEVLLQQQSHFHKLDYTSRIPVTTPVGKPETIGADRLGLVVAATDLFPDRHNLVIGLGSCITYNFVNRFHEFLGGSISPGMEMRFKAMHEYTAKLPLVKAEWNFPLVGYDTKTNMLSGTILGMCKEIDGIIEAYEERYSRLNVLLTGGDMQFFTPHLRKKVLADADLMYKGLYAISRYNR